MQANPLPLICAYENRPECEDGVRVLVASLKKAIPHARLRLYHNPAREDFADWIARYPGVDWRPAQLPASTSWNVKPEILTAAFDDGYEDVIWLDADLLVARDFSDFLAQCPNDALIATEEASWGAWDDSHHRRTRGWLLEPGRQLPFTVNSCFLRVTSHHRGLIEAWQELLSRPEYKAAQAAEWHTRPAHMMGDQDVLTALLGSREFADIDVRFLRRGRHILQLFGPLGFTLNERLQVARAGLPLIIHAQGTKPWKPPAPDGSRRWYGRLFDIYQDTSAYIMFVEKHLAEETRFAWLAPRSSAGALLRKLGLGSISLAGAPIAAIFDAVWQPRRLLRRLRLRG
ncbi:MAG: hypothetical protein QNI87_03220 [Erythrobacter sp.]|uniref:hypothetical protein n=1 Tax=Erythrobacter sp. TaxID=1042 RepID=UPI0026340152|nr:hypothetical protein [Erythrobacter sp.]MDJ0977522.1 hypothetical protein [Erythrobacter sp.]